ncbi:hypothetical protein [Paenibacillus sp. GXUN7292]|uniref:hypothetical protein n=1 Tax=Paenibacillus sp. GXUN7292 TaxID=3422499 RepID=UPI003D7C500C
MNKAVFIDLLDCVKRKDHERLFEVVQREYDEVVAVQAIDALLISKDLQAEELQQSCTFIGGGKVDVIEKSADSDAQEMFFVIPLSEDWNYRLGCSVEFNQHRYQIWFHHVQTNEKLKQPELCVPWDELNPLDQAMWSLLISKVERLEPAFFEEMYQSCWKSQLFDDV